VGPLFVLGVATFAVEACRRSWAQYSRPSWQALPAQLAQQGHWWIATVCLMAMSFTFRVQKDSPSFHRLADTRHDAAILNDAFRRNLPVIERSVSLVDGVPYARGLSTAYAVYFHDKYLSQSTAATRGWLPNIQDGVRITTEKKPLGYILRDEKAYRDGELKALIDSDCAVVVGYSTKKNSIEVSSKAKLPEKCKAPRGQAIPR
jgi:hypothetical protein